MNREYLKGLGLEKEVIDSIMAEHGKAVQAAKPTEEFEELKSEKESLAQKIADMNSSLTSLTDAKATIENEKEESFKEIKTRLREELNDLYERYGLDLVKISC